MENVNLREHKRTLTTLNLTFERKNRYSLNPLIGDAISNKEYLKINYLNLKQKQ